MIALTLSRVDVAALLLLVAVLCAIVGAVKAIADDVLYRRRLRALYQPPTAPVARPTPVPPRRPEPVLVDATVAQYERLLAAERRRREEAIAERDAARSILRAQSRQYLAIDTARLERDCTQELPRVPALPAIEAGPISDGITVVDIARWRADHHDTAELERTVRTAGPPLPAGLRRPILEGA